MKKSIISTGILFLLLSPATSPYLRADTIRLYQGTMIVGKIVSEDKTSIVFANKNGTFRIKKIRIDDIYKTDSYQEDIAVHQKLKVPYNSKAIRIHYLAGEARKLGKKRDKKKEAREKEETEKKKQKTTPPAKRTSVKYEGDHWTSGRLSFSGAFLYNLGSSRGNLPYGYAGYFAIDQGLDFKPGKRHPMIPGLRFDFGFIYFNKSSYKMTGYIGGAGLMWAFPSIKNRWGCFVLALIPGAALVDVAIKETLLNGGGTSRSIDFAGQAVFGYQKSFGVFSMFIQARYLYIYEMGSGSYFHTLSGELGFGFNAW